MLIGRQEGWVPLKGIRLDFADISVIAVLTNRGIMYRFEIKKINLKSSSGIFPLSPRSVNVVVGPNNSGKSRILREIRDYLLGDESDVKIVEGLECSFPESFEELDESYGIANRMLPDSNGNYYLRAYSNKPSQPYNVTASVESSWTRFQPSYGGNWVDYFSDLVARGQGDRPFFECFGSLFFRYMGTEERLTICKAQMSYGLDSPQVNYLSSVKYRKTLLDALSDKTQELFGLDVFLDSQTLGNRLVFRCASERGAGDQGLALDETAAKNLFECPRLDDQGDGLKSFVSTFLSLNDGQADYLFLDEPEAFLHPPLARQLGEIIGESSDGAKGVFVATHSVEILKGILSKCDDVNVIRVVRGEGGMNGFRLLESDLLKTTLETPLLRVSRVLEGLFCDKVVLTEAEADELVYQEYIEKAFPHSGLYFAHGQNKQTLALIADMYRRIGVGFEVVVDFDIFRISKEFRELLVAVGVPEAEIGKFVSYTDKMREMIDFSVEMVGGVPDELEKDKKLERDRVYHEMGARHFDDDVRGKIKGSISVLRGYHLHILSTGELETFLEDYGLEYGKNKSEWVVKAVEKISHLGSEDFKIDNASYRFAKGIVSA